MAGLDRAALRTRCKQRADMENSEFVADAEWNSYLDEAASELHDLIMLSDPSAMQTVGNINVVAGVESYALPTDFYKAQAVYWVSGGVRYALKRFDYHELGSGDEITNASVYGGSPYRYALLGSNIWFFPEPSATGTVELFYYPSYTRFVDDTSTIDYPVVNGWEQFIILTCAIKAKMKEESDASFELSEKALLLDRIRKMAAKRDQFEPLRARDEYGITNRFRRTSLTRTRHFY